MNSARAASQRALAVWRFACCERCLRPLRDCERRLRSALDGELHIARFRGSAGLGRMDRYDLSLVQGPITTVWAAARLRAVRLRSRRLVALGACASGEGLRALRAAAADARMARGIGAWPGHLDALRWATPIAELVRVDYQLRGCPVDGDQLFEVAAAYLSGRRPMPTDSDACGPCRKCGTVCVAVVGDVACLGPATQAGCGVPCTGCSGALRAARVNAMARLALAQSA